MAVTVLREEDELARCECTSGSVREDDAVRSEEQVAAEEKQQQQQDSRSSSPSSPVGALIGGLTRRAANRNSTPAGAHATFMTMTNEVLKVATTVSDADLAIPAGFKENK